MSFLGAPVDARTPAPIIAGDLRAIKAERAAASSFAPQPAHSGGAGGFDVHALGIDVAAASAGPSPAGSPSGAPFLYFPPAPASPAPGASPLPTPGGGSARSSPKGGAPGARPGETIAETIQRAMADADQERSRSLVELELQRRGVDTRGRSEYDLLVLLEERLDAESSKAAATEERVSDNPAVLLRKQKRVELANEEAVRVAVQKAKEATMAGGEPPVTKTARVPPSVRRSQYRPRAYVLDGAPLSPADLEWERTHMEDEDLTSYGLNAVWRAEEARDSDGAAIASAIEGLKAAFVAPELARLREVVIRAVGQRGVLRLEAEGRLAALGIPGLLVEAAKDVCMGPVEALEKRKRLGREGARQLLREGARTSGVDFPIDPRRLFVDTLTDIKRTRAARMLVLRAATAVQEMRLEGEALGYGEGDEVTAPRQMLVGAQRLLSHMSEVRHAQHRFQARALRLRGQLRVLEATAWRLKIKLSTFERAHATASEDVGRIRALLTAAGIDKRTLSDNLSFMVVQDEVKELAARMAETEELITGVTDQTETVLMEAASTAASLQYTTRRVHEKESLVRALRMKVRSLLCQGQCATFAHPPLPPFSVAGLALHLRRQGDQAHRAGRHGAHHE